MADQTTTPQDDPNDVPAGEDIEYSLDDPNLALKFPKEELDKVAKKVLTDFQAAWDSSEKYRKRRAKDWAIFAGDLPDKEFPYAEACNAHVPFMLTTLTRLHARIMGEIFQNWQGPLHFTSTTDSTDAQADLVEAHTAWQFREDIPDFKRQMARALMFLLNHGDMTVHSAYDFQGERNRHDVLSPDEFVTPYVMTAMMPDWSDVPFKCRVSTYYEHELEQMIGTWNGVEEALEHKASHDDEPDRPITDQAMKTEGVEEEDELEAPHKTILYEGWMKLPGDDRHRYVQAIVHKESKIVFCLRLHEMPDWKDKARYDQQSAEKDNFLAMQAQHEQATLQNQQGLQQVQQSVMQTPMLDPQQAEQAQGQLQMHLQAQDILEQSAPQPPAWMNAMEPPETQMPVEPKTVPIQTFVHAVCIEPMVGSIGLGYGGMLADYNRAANTALSQYIDAATLSNCWGLVVSDIVKFKEQFIVKPGHVNRVTGLSMQQVKDNIMELKAPPPENSLIQLVQLFGSYAQELAQAPDVLSGDPGKSGETAKGLLTRIDQATKQISAIAGTFGEALKTVGRNNCLLNSMFLPDEQLFPFVDPSGQGQMKKITRQVYDQTYTIELRSDLQFSSKQQKVQEANELMGIIGELTPLQQNPAFVYQAIVKMLQARDLGGMVQFLGACPPPPQVFGPPPPPPGTEPIGPPGSTGKPAGPKEDQKLPGASPPPQLPNPASASRAPLPGNQPQAQA